MYENNFGPIIVWSVGTQITSKAPAGNNATLRKTYQQQLFTTWNLVKWQTIFYLFKRQFGGCLQHIYVHFKSTVL